MSNWVITSSTCYQKVNASVHTRLVYQARPISLAHWKLCIGSREKRVATALL